MRNPKINGYAHPRSNPGSRVNDRRARAAALLELCHAEHPRRANGRCAIIWTLTKGA